MPSTRRRSARFWRALAPLIAKDQLQGNAGTYGLMLGAAGVGAVFGALQIARLRKAIGTERAVRLMALGTGAFMVVIAFTRSESVVLAAMFVTGACSIMSYSMLNVGVQLTAPRWVTARALSLFSSALTGGIAIGSAVWGAAVAPYGLPLVFAVSGIAVMLTVIVGFISPLPHSDGEGQDTIGLDNEVAVSLDLSMRSGPLCVEIEYDVDPEQARNFYDVMRRVQKVRMRNGGFNWTISRDIGAPNIWLERYHCPTWGDYLRMRDRYTTRRSAPSTTWALDRAGEVICLQKA
jgi:Transmembrane secretion effector